MSKQIEDVTGASDFMKKTLADQRDRFVSDLKGVHPALADWAAGEFEKGHSINGVKGRIIAAARVAHPEHSKWPFTAPTSQP